jgi:hypothetical protein
MNEGEVGTNKFKEYMKGAIAEAQNINEYDKFGIIPRSARIQEV